MALSPQSRTYRERRFGRLGLAGVGVMTVMTVMIVVPVVIRVGVRLGSGLFPFFPVLAMRLAFNVLLKVLIGTAPRSATRPRR